MRRVSIVALLLVALVGCQKEPPMELLKADEPIRVEARVDRAQARVGDRVAFRVSIFAKEGVEATLPYALEGMLGLELRDAKAPEIKQIGQDRLMSREWILTPEKTGSYVFSPMEVRYRLPGEGTFQKAKTPGVYLEVLSILRAGDAEGDIRDIKRQASLPSVLWMIVAAIAAALVLGALATAAVLRFRKRPAAPPLPPHRWALDALEKLMRSGLLESGKYRLFTEQVSDILRRYIEKAFGIMAGERTTEEFIQEMRANKVFADRQRDLLARFLGFCDMVKFAKYTPAKNELSEGATIVKEFVEESKPAPVQD